MGYNTFSFSFKEIITKYNWTGISLMWCSRYAWTELFSPGCKTANCSLEGAKWHIVLCRLQNG